MQLTLEFIEGQDKEGNDIIKEKTFIANIKARSVRKAMTLVSEVDMDNLSPEGLDKVISYVCDIYGNKFTIDEFYDGLPCDKLLSTLRVSVEGVINGVTGVLNTFPSN